MDQRNHQMAYPPTPTPSLMQMVKVQQCGSPSQTRTDVERFLLQVRVGTEANQLTVNKWSPGFYWARERKQECRSTSSGRHTPTHTNTHTLWLTYYMPLKSDEEGTDCGQIYKKTLLNSSLQFQIPRQIWEGLWFSFVLVDITLSTIILILSEWWHRVDTDWEI